MPFLLMHVRISETRISMSFIIISLFAPSNASMSGVNSKINRLISLGCYNKDGSENILRKFWACRAFNCRKSYRKDLFLDWNFNETAWMEKTFFSIDSTVLIATFFQHRDKRYYFSKNTFWASRVEENPLNLDNVNVQILFTLQQKQDSNHERKNHWLVEART